MEEDFFPWFMAFAMVLFKKDGIFAVELSPTLYTELCMFPDSNHSYLADIWLISIPFKLFFILSHFEFLIKCFMLSHSVPVILLFCFKIEGYPKLMLVRLLS